MRRLHADSIAQRNTTTLGFRVLGLGSRARLGFSGSEVMYTSRAAESCLLQLRQF